MPVHSTIEAADRPAVECLLLTIGSSACGWHGREWP